MCDEIQRERRAQCSPSLRIQSCMRKMFIARRRNGSGLPEKKCNWTMGYCLCTSHSISNSAKFLRNADEHSQSIWDALQHTKITVPIVSPLLKSRGHQKPWSGFFDSNSRLDDLDYDLPKQVRKLKSTKKRKGRSRLKIWTNLRSTDCAAWRTPYAICAG